MHAPAAAMPLPRLTVNHLPAGLDGMDSQPAPADPLRVAGEVVVNGEGCFIGMYALNTDQGYVAYAKLFLVRPESAWASKGALFKVSVGPMACPAEAAHRALQLAHHRWTHSRTQRSSRLAALRGYLARDAGVSSKANAA